ncbi:MAG: LysR family transcriptional regulator [Pseudomonadota bacterium]
MSNLPPPTWLRTFETAARLGGFTAAADSLGLTPAAVSQQIRALEVRLGFRLFNRLPRGVQLSEMGRAYLPSVRQAFEDLEAATGGLFGIGQPLAVTVRTPISFAALQLPAMLDDFRTAYPEIPIRICTAVWADGLDEASVDVDIRFGDGCWPGAEVTRLTEPVSVPVMPPEVDPSELNAKSMLQMGAARAIHVTGYENLWARFARFHKLEEIQIDTNLSADSSLVALEMVAYGLGCAMIARDLATDHIERGRVAAAMNLSLQHGHAHHLVRPVRAVSERQEVVLFRNWLVRRFTKQT